MPVQRAENGYKEGFRVYLCDNLGIFIASMVIVNESSCTRNTKHNESCMFWIFDRVCLAIYYGVSGIVSQLRVPWRPREWNMLVWNVAAVCIYIFWRFNRLRAMVACCDIVQTLHPIEWQISSTNQRYRNEINMYTFNMSCKARNRHFERRQSTHMNHANIYESSANRTTNEHA